MEFATEMIGRRPDGGLRVSELPIVLHKDGCARLFLTCAPGATAFASRRDHDQAAVRVDPG